MVKLRVCMNHSLILIGRDICTCAYQDHPVIRHVSMADVELDYWIPGTCMTVTDSVSNVPEVLVWELFAAETGVTNKNPTQMTSISRKYS